MVSLYGPWRRKSLKVSSVKEWWWMGQEGGAVEPTQVRARCQKVRGLRLSGAGAITPESAMNQAFPEAAVKRWQL